MLPLELNERNIDALSMDQPLRHDRLGFRDVGRRACQTVAHGAHIVEGRLEWTMSEAESRALLAKAGLRPTRQRLLLAGLLFGQGHRHVTAESLHGEVSARGEHVSLATVYNALHQFKEAGLLRELAIEGSKAYFDTNTSNHNHFYLESEGRLMDISGVRVEGMPEPPAGMRISHVDVVIRLVKK